ncbi:hypothetical protein EYC80_007601 [Monilinia laxa]|uniref:Uncharacterized protein n=1 Tax=Monilinia laxa TaxID=61186 RepID=A0A5N6JWN5_MONLA|nr:hypothetical protein EYC80_007601 [Monilinia laxa]
MSESNTNKPPIAINIVAVAILMGVSFTAPFIALDIIHIPYISHGLASLLSWANVGLSPIYPFWAPVLLGTSIKIYQHEPFPKQKQWVASSILMLIPHVGQILTDTLQLLGVFDEVCSFGSCRRQYIQAGSFAVVIIGETIGFPWDAKVVQKWIEKLAVECEKEAEKDAAASVEDEMEKGVVDQPSEEAVCMHDVKSGLHEEHMLI